MENEDVGCSRWRVTEEGNSMEGTKQGKDSLLVEQQQSIESTHSDTEEVAMGHKSMSVGTN